jgi:hypothetical protein
MSTKGPDLFTAGRSERTEADRLLQAGEHVRRLSTALDAARKAAATGDLSLAGARLGTAKDLLTALKPCIEEWDAITAEWTKALENRFLELASDFERACGARGWRIDGHWPDLYVERAIAVRIHDKERTATVASHVLNHADVSGLVAILEPLVRDLIPKKFSPGTFLQTIADAYDEVRGSSSQVSILAVYRAFVVRQQKARFWRDARQELFVGLSIDQFRARLAATLEAGMVRIGDGRELRLIPPIEPSDSIYLFQPSERRFGYVGRIEFVAR